MSPRIYQLCREAVTYMAVQESSLAKRISKAYFLFLIHIDMDDLPKSCHHHLTALTDAFANEADGILGVTELSDEDSQRLSRNVVDLFNSVADHFNETA